jgi:hypothetical protein
LRPLALIAGLAAASLLQCARAGGEQKVEKLVVIGTPGGEILDAASEGTVTREQLENRPLPRPGEILEAVPGLIVTQHSGSGKANQFFLRGFNLDHGTDFRTTVLGMPVNLPTHAHGQGYTDLNFVIPELVSAIHYRKGTYYAEEGDFSAAGAAHIDYVRTLPAPLAQLTLGADRYQRLVVAGSVAGASGGGWLAAAEAQREDGPWTLGEDLRKSSGVLRWSSADVDGLTITAMTYRNRWNSTDQVARRAIDSGLIGRFGNLDPTLGGRTSRHSLSAEWQGRGDASVTRATAYAFDYGLNLFSNFTYFLDDPVHGDQFEQADRRRAFGGTLQHAVSGRIGDLEMENAVGAELRQDRIGTVGLYHTLARERLETTREDAVRQTSYSAWVRNTVQWGPKLRTVAGLRADAFRFNVASNLAANSGSASDGIVNPKLSLVLGPFAESELFVNLGGGFHSNDARGATIRVDPSTGEAAEKVKPLVRARGAEIGWHAHLTPAWQTVLTIWRLDLASELLFVGDAGTTEASRPSVRSGVEWSHYWRPAQGLIVDADLAISRARFRGNGAAGDRIPGAIERTASAGITYTPGPWAAGLRLRYFGPRPLTEDGTVRSASSMLANLRLGYRFTPRLNLTLDVLNALDRMTSDIDYYYASRLAGEGAPVADIHTHPAEPRSLRATLTLSF